MRKEGGELDFLAGTELEVDPFSFEQVVKEAFWLEHRCVQDQDIAEVIGKSKGRLSQIFTNPSGLKPDSIQMLLRHLESPAHKRRIVQAWNSTCFGKDINAGRSIRLQADQIDETTLKRIDRLIRQSRLHTAVVVAAHGATKARDDILKEQFLDRYFFLRLRLDQPGLAMQIARQIGERAYKRGELLRLAAAHYFRALALGSVADSTPSELEPILAEIERLVAKEPELLEKPPYALASTQALESLRLTIYITFLDRGFAKFDKSYLERKLDDLLTECKSRGRRAEKFRPNVQLARIYLALGQTFQAQEHLDQAFEAVGVQKLNSYEICGVVKARIMHLTEPLDVVSSYLRDVLVNCERTLDYQHMRLAEYDLARIENERCAALR